MSVPNQDTKDKEFSYNFIPKKKSVGNRDIEEMEDHLRAFQMNFRYRHDLPISRLKKHPV